MSKTQKADRARATLEHVGEALTEIRTRHHRRFEQSAPEEQEVREDAHRMLRALTQLEQELHKAINAELISKKGQET